MIDTINTDPCADTAPSGIPGTLRNMHGIIRIPGLPEDPRDKAVLAAILSLLTDDTPPASRHSINLPLDAFKTPLTPEAFTRRIQHLVLDFHIAFESQSPDKLTAVYLAPIWRSRVELSDDTPTTVTITVFPTNYFTSCLVDRDGTPTPLSAHIVSMLSA